MYSDLSKEKITRKRLFFCSCMAFKDLFKYILITTVLLWLPYYFWAELNGISKSEDNLIVALDTAIIIFLNCLSSTIIITALKYKILPTENEYSIFSKSLLFDFLKIIAVSLLAFIIITASSLFFLIPGLIAIILFSFLPQPIIFKELSPWNALKLSITLARKRFGLILFINVIFIFTSILPLLFESFNLEFRIVTNLILTIPYIFYIISLTLLFVNIDSVFSQDTDEFNKLIAGANVENPQLEYPLIEEESKEVHTNSDIDLADETGKGLKTPNFFDKTAKILDETSKFSDEIPNGLLSKLRHPNELFLYYTCVFLNLPFAVIYISLFLLLIIDSFTGFSHITKYIEQIQNWDVFTHFSENSIGTIQGLFILVFFPIAIVLYLGKLYAQIRCSSIKLTRNQFKEVYEIADTLAKRMGFKETPQIYLQQNGGFINAFSARFRKNNFIQIWSQLFEIAYLENKDFDTLAFVIAHELAHIKLRHTYVTNIYSLFFVSLIPGLNIFALALSRAREYSCDRIASYLVPEGRDGFMVLIAGKRLYKLIDIDDYLLESNQKGFFVFFVNLLSSHPIPTKRFRALKGIDNPKIL